MTDVDGVLEVESGSKTPRGVGRIVIHVVAGVGLRRAAVAAAIMRDDAKTLVQEEQHLGVPVVGRQRPAVMEHNRLSVLSPQSL